MSKYSMQLRRVCDIFSRNEVESWFKSYSIEDYLTPEQIEVLDSGTWSKNKLAKKIVDHYFMREIGFETPFLFKHYVNITMEEIMEEKLPLIYSAAIKYDPLVNVDFIESFERDLKNEGNSNSNVNSNGTSTSNSGSLSINNSTPQGKITKQQLDSGAYASSVNQSDIEDSTTTNSISNSESDSESTTKETYTRSQKGNSGVSATAQKMVEQFRDNIRAIDKEIIEELNVLFMAVY